MGREGGNCSGRRADGGACRSAPGRSGERDISDIEALALAIGIRDAATALSLVEAFYPSASIPPKVRFGVEEIMERVRLRHGSGAPPAAKPARRQRKAAARKR